MTYFNSLTKKLIVISAVLLCILAMFIWSIYSFTVHMRDESVRITMASQLRYSFSAMAWHAQLVADRDLIQPSHRAFHITELKNGLDRFDQLTVELRDGVPEKGLSRMNDADAAQLLDRIIDRWKSQQQPALKKVLDFPLEVPERDIRKILLSGYDASMHESFRDADNLVGILEEELRADSAQYYLIIVFLIGFFGVAAVLLTAYSRNSFIKPVRRLRDAAREIEKGNFGVAVDVKTSDEMGELSKAFNAMAAQLRDFCSAQSRRTNDLLALNIASNNIIGLTDPRILYKAICENILKLYDLRLVWIGLVEEGTFVVNPVAEAGEEVAYLPGLTVTWDEAPTCRGPSGLAIKTGLPQIIDRIEAEPSYAPWIERARNRGFQSVMAAPLICSGNRIIGSINLYSDLRDYFNEEKKEVLQIFANQSAALIDNARMIEELEKAVQARTLELEDAKLIAESANLSKTVFLANMSHELRTPLNVIIGFSDALVSGIYGTLKQEHAEYVEYILKSGTRLLSLINSIMELTSADTGDMTPEYTECSLDALLHEAAGMFHEKAKKHRISLQVKPEEGLLTCLVDQNKIKYVIFTLLTNAIKNTGDGGTVRVSVRRGIQDSGFVSDEKREVSRGPVQAIEITVSDTGPVIPEKQRETLFAPFHHTEALVSRPGEGLRIGLALCRRFIELHGGNIRTEPGSAGEGETTGRDQSSAEGTGNRFIVVLPQRPSDDKLMPGGGA